MVLNVNPERALPDDTNRHMINFYRAVQQGTLSTDTVWEFLQREGDRLLRVGQDHYYRVRERFNVDHDPHGFLFLNRSCFSGLIRFNRKGQFNTPFCRKPGRFRAAYVTKRCNQVGRITERRGILDTVNRGEFAYADPPYAGRYTDCYNSWSDEDAACLEDRLKTLPCPFLNSMWSENKYHRNDRLHEAFSEYGIRTFSQFYHLAATESLRNRITEALVVG